MFEPGDIVMLISGGPPMTVCRISNNNIKCCWFVENKFFNEAWFDLGTVIPYKE